MWRACLRFNLQLGGVLCKHVRDFWQAKEAGCLAYLVHPCMFGSSMTCYCRTPHSHPPTLSDMSMHTHLASLVQRVVKLSCRPTFEATAREMLVSILKRAALASSSSAGSRRRSLENRATCERSSVHGGCQAQIASYQLTEYFDRSLTPRGACR